MTIKDWQHIDKEIEVINNSFNLDWDIIKKSKYEYLLTTIINDKLLSLLLFSGLNGIFTKVTYENSTYYNFPTLNNNFNININNTINKLKEIVN